MNYEKKYHKYKTKYFQIKSELYGGGFETVSEPWFTLIKLGHKTVEGRLNVGRFKHFKEGDIITWTNLNFGKRTIETKVVYTKVYKTFKEYLESEELENALPGIDNIAMGLDVYYKYYSKEDERKNGVIAIKLQIV